MSLSLVRTGPQPTLSYLDVDPQSLSVVEGPHAWGSGSFRNRQSKPAYRADIDGLRAIAVLAVVAYHYREPFPYFPFLGGFNGVDVFFVISGFLITQILRADIDANTFFLLSFYDRRIRRILPALLVMLATSLFAGQFLLMPGDYQALAMSAAAAAFGFSNFYFLGNTGYFDQASDLMPLLHTWSLAVEEQFYLIWPVSLARPSGAPSV